LLHLISEDSRKQMLVFTRTKHGADRLTRQLEEAGVRAVAIHGNKSQNARTKALEDFKRGRVTLLVATDIAARGLDIDQLPVVVNFDLPAVAEDYVHRIGRTGRAGSEGLALSLVCQEEAGLLRDIQRLLKQDISVQTVAGFEPRQPLRMQNAGPTQRPVQQQRRGPAPGRSNGGGRSGERQHAGRTGHSAGRPGQQGGGRANAA